MADKVGGILVEERGKVVRADDTLTTD